MHVNVLIKFIREKRQKRRYDKAAIRLKFAAEIESI